MVKALITAHKASPNFRHKGRERAPGKRDTMVQVTMDEQLLGLLILQLPGRTLYSFEAKPGNRPV